MTSSFIPFLLVTSFITSLSSHLSYPVAHPFKNKHQCGRRKKYKPQINIGSYRKFHNDGQGKKLEEDYLINTKADLQRGLNNEEFQRIYRELARAVVEEESPISEEAPGIRRNYKRPGSSPKKVWRKSWAVCNINRHRGFWSKVKSL